MFTERAHRSTQRVETKKAVAPAHTTLMKFLSREHQLSLSRRTFLTRSAFGLGGLALASLGGAKAKAASFAAKEGGKWHGVMNPPQFPPRARRVIHLCMAGGPSHLESFDHKPALRALDGK